MIKGDTMKLNQAMTGTLALLLAGLAWPAGGAGAAEIKVLSTGNMQSVLGDLKPEFERMSGHKLAIEYGSTTRIRDRIQSGEAADVTINERFVLEDLLRQDRIAGTIAGIARSPLGIGVRAGAGKPDISTPEALKRALLAADSVAHPDPSGGAQDGTYFVGLIARLGIADELKPKIKITQGGDAAAQLVASGGAQIGVAQRRNFISLKGVELLEPLPNLPGMKFIMVGGVVAGAQEPAAATALLGFLASPAAAATIAARGMELYAQ
jgi:molybdate transport system substrate-binding protein